MTAQELREKFIKFFEEKGHKVIPSAPLVPENDPSVLFTTAGMHPLVPYLLGEKHPQGKRLVNIQKCLRTDDIDEIGDIQHLTFFEMLGYWSMGDYFKKESIRYTFDFYTKVLGFDKDKMSVTVFAGDKDAPFDKNSYNVWKNEIGISEKQIYKYPKKENWWGPVSETGPCGPCTEMFIDTGIKACGKDCGPACNCDKFVEIGNNVFMEYFKNKAGKFEKLKQKNVDVGLGYERLLMIVNGNKTVFETELFSGIVSKIKELAKNESEKSIRIIADHLRAATFALAEKVEPSNLDRGYVVRRLIRRAIRHGKLIGIKDKFTSKIAKEVVKSLGDVYPELKKNEQFICSELDKEEERFGKVLEKGLKQFENLRLQGGFGQGPIGRYSFGAGPGKIISGKKAFDLYQTYGFPIEMIEEEVKRVDARVNRKEFDKEYKKHQELSRKGAEKKFKGGLGEQSTEAIKYHTATHLLHQALRTVLGDHVKQAGSNITAERLRFDFSHSEKMKTEEIKKVEDLVNKQIKNSLPVIETITSVEKAKSEGAIGIFDSKYEDKVKVYSIGDPARGGQVFSKEICGGPHVKNTSELGHFKVVKEEASSAGIRRIKAILE